MYIFAFYCVLVITTHASFIVDLQVQAELAEVF